MDIRQVKQIEQDCRLGSWSLRDYQDEVGRKDTLSFVVIEQNQVIGFVVARLIIFQHPYLYPLCQSNQTIYQSNQTSYLANIKMKSEYINTEVEIEIYNLAVNPNFQKKGIGHHLINQLLNYTIHLKPRAIWLEVRESNKNAIKFYKKNKFTEVFKRKNFYNNPVEDGVVMKRSLINF